MTLSSQNTIIVCGVPGQSFMTKKSILSLSLIILNASSKTDYWSLSNLIHLLSARLVLVEGAVCLYSLRLIVIEENFVEYVQGVTWQ